MVRPLEQVVPKGCAAFILYDIQNPAGHNPEQPAVVNCTLSKEVALMVSEIPSICNDSVILCLLLSS